MAKIAPRLDAGLLGVRKGEAAAEPMTQERLVQEERRALTLRVPLSLHGRLRKAAFDQDRPMQDIIFEALEKHLEA